METRIEVAPVTEIAADWLVVPMYEGHDLAGPLAALNEACNGLVGRLSESSDLSGKLAETLPLHDTPSIQAKRLLFVGLGPADRLDTPGLEKAIMTAAREISRKPGISAAFLLPETVGTGISRADAARITATAISVGCVGQGLYQSSPGRFEFDSAAIVVESDALKSEIEPAVERGRVLGESINLTRELVNRMADEIYPESCAERAAVVATDCGLSCRVLDEHQMKDEGMRSLLAVAIGSDRPPRIVVLEHKGAGDDAPTLALVGKGVTFDSGGLSLKPTDSMKTMKCDMAGAATVLGAMTAIARLNLPVNVVGYMGLVENMISGSSYKLGDVLHARNGVSIEVLNTDAEGRLVLADVLSYAADKGADRMIDLATLTGACVVALGEEYTGVFTNDQEWCDSVLAAAEAAGELVWQMPMHDLFADLLKSDVADCKNVGPRWGGAITAAKFLEKFVAGKPWVHLDIAGPSFASSGSSNREGGATGCMVNTLVEVAANFA